MAELKFIDPKSGKEKKGVELDDSILKMPLRKDLLNEYVIMQRRALRQGTHSTKTRTEVSATGKKPFRQKGTGNARQGSLVGPHQIGGGICFGPKPRKYSSKMTKKTKKKAICAALSQKNFEKSLYAIDTFEVSSGKTKDALQALSGLKTESVLLVGNFSEATERSIRNLPRVKILRPGFLNVKDILYYDKCLMTEEALKWLGDETREAA